MNLSRTLSLSTLALLCLSAQAQNELSFKDTVISKFTTEDSKMLLATVKATLADPAADAKRDWKGEGTGASGTVSVVRAYKNGKIPCRDVKIVNRFKSETGESSYQFCEDASREFKLVGPVK